MSEFDVHEHMITLSKKYLLSYTVTVDGWLQLDRPNMVRFEHIIKVALRYE